MTQNAAPRQWDCAETRIALGVYVLGAIDPDERALVDAHLAACDACQGELTELAGLPALLAMVPAEEAVALAEGLPGDDLLAGPPVATLPGGQDWARPRQAARAAPEPPAGVRDLSAARRRRRQLLTRAAVAAAAAVVVGAASFGGVRLAGLTSAPAQVSADQHPNGQPNGPWVTARGGNGQAAATVAYRPMGWGTQLDALVTGIPVNTRCQLWVVQNDGTRVQVGGWDTDAAEGTVWYPASASLPATDVRAFVITVSGGKDITVTPA